MRVFIFIFSAVVSISQMLPAETSRVKAIKVLRHLVDAKGRHTLSPSLLDRDAYQAHLREHPEAVGGMRFELQWKLLSGVLVHPIIRVDIRHGSGNTIGQFTKSAPIKAGKKRRSQWHRLAISSEEYARLGAIMAWRVSLWDGERMLARWESFLW